MTKTTWEPWQDEKLLELREQGQSFGALAPHIGKSRNACLSRWHRLIRTKFPSNDQFYRQLWRNKRRRKDWRQLKVEREKLIIYRIDSYGIPDIDVILKAKWRGISITAIAQYFELTKPAICNRIAKAEYERLNKHSANSGDAWVTGDHPAAMFISLRELRNCVP